MFPNLAIDVLRGTPVWVFILFIVLLRLGLQQLTPTVRMLRRLWLTPALFITWGLVGLFTRSGSVTPIATCWLIGAGVGALLALPLDFSIKVDRTRGLVWQPGSAFPLARNMGLFFGHYLLHVATAIHPDARNSLVAWDIAVSGLSAGYFVAWSLRFARRYADSPEMDLGDAAAACPPSVVREPAAR